MFVKADLRRDRNSASKTLVIVIFLRKLRRLNTTICPNCLWRSCYTKQVNQLDGDNLNLWQCKLRCFAECESTISTLDQNCIPLNEGIF